MRCARAQLRMHRQAHQRQRRSRGPQGEPRGGSGRDQGGGCHGVLREAQVGLSGSRAAASPDCPELRFGPKSEVFGRRLFLGTVLDAIVQNVSQKCSLVCPEIQPLSGSSSDEIGAIQLNCPERPWSAARRPIGRWYIVVGTSSPLSWYVVASLRSNCA